MTDEAPWIGCMTLSITSLHFCIFGHKNILEAGVAKWPILTAGLALFLEGITVGVGRLLY